MQLLYQAPEVVLPPTSSTIYAFYVQLCSEFYNVHDRDYLCSVGSGNLDMVTKQSNQGQGAALGFFASFASPGRILGPEPYLD